MYHKYTGVILKKHPLGEADELLTIYTREAGKIRAKAVGSRKIQSRLAGHLQSLNEIEFETASRSTRRPFGFSRDGLPVLISVRARTINSYLRQNLKKFAHALIGIETLYRLAPDYQENVEAYQALAEFLKNLGESLDERFEVRLFQLHLLRSSGFNLPLQFCLNCQRVLPGRDKPAAYFVAAKGGFFCPACAALEKADVSLTEEAHRQLAALSAGKIVRELDREAEQTIEGFLNYVLEREIKSNGFLQTLNQEA